MCMSFTTRTPATLSWTSSARHRNDRSCGARVTQGTNPTYHDILRSDAGTPGCRHAVLIDLSPIATYITQNYVKHTILSAFRSQAEAAILESTTALGWMYETRHVGWPMLEGSPSEWRNASRPHSKTPGTVNFFIWSERFVCPDCFWRNSRSRRVTDLALGTNPTDFSCPSCGGAATKRLLRAMETAYDPFLQSLSNECVDEFGAY